MINIAGLEFTNLNELVSFVVSISVIIYGCIKLIRHISCLKVEEIGFKEFCSFRESKNGEKMFDVILFKLTVVNKWFRPAIEVLPQCASLISPNIPNIHSLNLYWNPLNEVKDDKLYFFDKLIPDGPIAEYRTHKLSKLLDKYAEYFYDVLRTLDRRTIERKYPGQEIILAFQLTNDQKKRIYFVTQQKLERQLDDDHIIEIKFYGDYLFIRPYRIKLKINFAKKTFEKIDC